MALQPGHFLFPRRGGSYSLPSASERALERLRVTRMGLAARVSFAMADLRPAARRRGVAATPLVAAGAAVVAVAVAVAVARA